MLLILACIAAIQQGPDEEFKRALGDLTKQFDAFDSASADAKDVPDLRKSHDDLRRRFDNFLFDFGNRLGVVEPIFRMSRVERKMARALRTDDPQGADAHRGGCLRHISNGRKMAGDAFEKRLILLGAAEEGEARIDFAEQGGTGVDARSELEAVVALGETYDRFEKGEELPPEGRRIRAYTLLARERLKKLGAPAK